MALLVGDVETPSDISGVLYIPSTPPAPGR
jgi:hypothetical protein